jgi:hypothetical protein
MADPKTPVAYKLPVQGRNFILDEEVTVIEGRHHLVQGTVMSFTPGSKPRTGMYVLNLKGKAESVPEASVEKTGLLL